MKSNKNNIQDKEQLLKSVIVDNIIKIFAENNLTIDEANKILYETSKTINQQVVQVF